MDNLSLHLPLIVEERGTIHIFDSIKSLVESLELIDIKNGEYNFYDMKGTKFIPHVKGETFALTQSSEDGTTQLRQSLVDALQWAHDDGRFGILEEDFSVDKSLEHLVKCVRKFS